MPYPNPMLYELRFFVFIAEELNTSYYIFKNSNDNDIISFANPKLKSEITVVFGRFCRSVATQMDIGRQKKNLGI